MSFSISAPSTRASASFNRIFTLPAHPSAPPVTAGYSNCESAISPATGQHRTAIIKVPARDGTEKTKRFSHDLHELIRIKNYTRGSLSLHHGQDQSIQKGVEFLGKAAQKI